MWCSKLDIQFVIFGQNTREHLLHSNAASFKNTFTNFNLGRWEFEIWFLNLDVSMWVFWDRFLKFSFVIRSFNLFLDFGIWNLIRAVTFWNLICKTFSLKSNFQGTESKIQESLNHQGLEVRSHNVILRIAAWKRNIKKSENQIRLDFQ